MHIIDKLFRFLGMLAAALLIPIAMASETASHCVNSSQTAQCATKADNGPKQSAMHRSRTTHTASSREREERQWQRTERELDKAQMQGQSPHTGKGVHFPNQQCEALNQRIKKNDDLARKGGNAAYVERLREDRQKARDAQFRLGC